MPAPQQVPYDPAQFQEFVLAHHVIGFFDKAVTFKSGRQSMCYVNWRTVAEDAFLMDRLSDFVIHYTSYLLNSGVLKESPHTFFGVPEGASKLALITQMKWAQASAHYGRGSHVLSMGRGKIKEHGMPKDRYFLGVPRGPTIVLEDVTTTGGSLLSTIDMLIESEIPIAAAISLTNRMEKTDSGISVEEVVGQRSSQGAPIKYFSLSNLPDLLPEAARRLKPSAEICRAIEREFDEVGVKRVVLS